MRLTYIGISLLLLIGTPSWAAKPSWLSCDPDKMTFKPVISVGEDQIAPPVQAKSKEGGETYFLSDEAPSHDSRVADAAEGKYFLGLESLLLNESGQKKRRIKLETWSKARIFGLDHPFPGALAALMRGFAAVKAAPPDKPAKVSKPDPEDVVKPDPKLLQAKGLFLRDLADNPYLRESWKAARKVRGTIPNPREEALAKMFDQVTEDPSLDQNKMVGELAADHPWHDRLSFLDLIAGVERGYVSLIKKYSATQKFMMPPTLPGLMEKYFRLEGDISEVAEPLEKAVSRWRVLFVASSVSALICKASEESKNIVALAQADQMGELKKLLKETFGTSIKIADAKDLFGASEEAEAPKPVSKPSPQPSAKP